MSIVSSSVLVAIVDQAAFIRITGRANFTLSVNFKIVISELRDRGFRRFMLDLTECATMDSTFLGVLAGHAMGSGIDPKAEAAVCVQLLNPNARVTELLESLGIAHLFPTCRGSGAQEMQFTPAAETDGHPSREEIAKTCLEAHQILMALNPENVAKFKDVAQFLAEDLKRLHS